MKTVTAITERIPSEALERLAEAAKKATPGGWFVIDHVDGEWTIQDRDGGAGNCIALQYGHSSRANATFIALANPSVVASLVEEVKELREANAWRPIETAPKDGRWIELWRGPTESGVWSPLVVARWWTFPDGSSAWAWPDDVSDPWHDVQTSDAYLERGDCYDSTAHFTHWRPLTRRPS